MYIRSVRLTDVPRLRRLRAHALRLNLPAALVTGFSPTRAALTNCLPVPSSARTFVLADKRPRAFIQTGARARGHRWEVLYLGAGLLTETVDSETHPWVHLLNFTALAAGRRRVTRLLAKAPSGEKAESYFREAQYQAYGQEQIYTKIFTAADRVVDDELDIRPQRPSDAWQVHRLYFLAAPRGVQDAEAYTSNHWELHAARPGGLREQGWLVDDGTETLAYARVLSRWRSHSIEWLFQPDHRDLRPHFVRQTLARLPAAPGDRVYCSLPEYQSDAVDDLEEAGFTLSATQTLMVRYLAVKATGRVRLFAPAAPGKARVVPSYMRRALPGEPAGEPTAAPALA